MVLSIRELHGNGDGGNTAVTAVIPRYSQRLYSEI